MGRLRQLLLLAGLALLGLLLSSALEAANDGTSQAVEVGSLRAARAADRVTVRLHSHLSQLSEGLLQLSQSAAFAAVLQEPQAGGARETVSVQRFHALRPLVFAAMPELDRSRWVIGLTDASGDALFAKGEAEPAAQLPGLKTEALLSLATEGRLQSVGDELYGFFELSLAPTDRAPRLILGSPALETDALAVTVRELGLSSLELVGGGGRALAEVGPEPLRTAARAADASGLRMLDGRLLPLDGPERVRWPWGKGAPRWLSVRSPLGVGGLSLVATVSLEPELGSLRRAGLRSALAVSLLILLLIGFGLVSRRRRPAAAPAPVASPLPLTGEPVEVPELEPSPLPTPKQSYSPQEAESSDPMDATRVMDVPDALLAASMATAPPSPSPLQGEAIETPGFDEEEHHHAVFMEFLAAREECGESSEGLTYDKFSTKLRKNREQLTQRLKCENVRFQVYVKDGKAAIKATPVRG